MYGNRPYGTGAYAGSASPSAQGASPSVEASLLQANIKVATTITATLDVGNVMLAANISCRTTITAVLIPFGPTLAAQISVSTRVTARLEFVGSVGMAVPLTVSIDPRDEAIYTAAAADVYRAKIGPVPGSGPVQGVVGLAFQGIDQLFAFRANPGRTATMLWKASPAGWVLVPYINQIEFKSGGLVEPFDGETLIQGAVSASIKRVHWEAGAWATEAGKASASGLFIIDAPTGGSFSAGTANTSGGATLKLTGPHTPIKMIAGGKFNFDKANFSGQLATRRIYGVDGVNRAFSFDGETLAPIRTGNKDDRPSQIRAHKNFLFLAQDSSLFYPGAGTPTKWSAVDGGGEIATGDIVTGMTTLPSSQTSATLAVFMRSNSGFLYGRDPTEFNFVIFNTGVGAAENSMQNLFDTFFLDTLGVVTLKASQAYGNFLPSTLTKNIAPFMVRQRGNLLASSINRAKSQYRLYFSDGYALFLTVLNQNYLGAGLAFFPNVMACTDSTNLLDGDEVTYAGAREGGYVYRLDIGTSFDGADISAYFVTAWDAIRSPRVLKRFRAASIEVQGDHYADIEYGYQLGYNSEQIAQPLPDPLTLHLGTVPHWDSFVWDAFVWDGGGLTPTDLDVTGDAENIRVTVSSGTNYIGAYTIDSIIHHYSMRRGMRP